MQQGNTTIPDHKDQQNTGPDDNKNNITGKPVATVADQSVNESGEEKPGQENNERRGGKTNGAGEETLGIP